MTTDDVSEVPTRKHRRAAQVASSSMSSPAKEDELRDDEDSTSSPSAKAAPLDVSPLCSALPPKSGEELQFGGPMFDDLDSEEEEEDRFASKRFVLKFLLVDSLAYVVCPLSLAVLRLCDLQLLQPRELRLQISQKLLLLRLRS